MLQIPVTGTQELRNSAPSVRKEVNFDVGVPGTTILSSRQVFGAQNGDDELVSHFVVPQLNL